MRLPYKFFLILIVCVLLSPFNSQSQNYWNELFENEYHNDETDVKIHPTMIVPREDHILAICQGSKTFVQSQLAIFKIGYDGSLISSAKYPDPGISETLLVGNHKYTQITSFVNSEDEVVTLLKYVPLGDNEDGWYEVEYRLAKWDDNSDSPIELIDVPSLNYSSENLYGVYGACEMEDGYLYSGRVIENNQPVYGEPIGMLTKIDEETGEEIWIQEYPSVAKVQSLQLDDEGNIWALGIANYDIPNESSFENIKFVIMKLNSDGELLKSHEFGGIAEDGNARIILEDNSVVVGGVTSVQAPPIGNGLSFEQRFFISRFQETEDGFEEQEMYVLDGNVPDDFDGIYYPEPSSEWFDKSNLYKFEDSYYLAGESDMSGIIIKFDQDFNIDWIDNYAGSPSISVNDFSRSSIRALIPIDEGGFLVAGDVTSYLNVTSTNSSSHQSLWMMRVDAQGCSYPGCRTTAVNEFDREKGRVLTAFPNPTNKEVNIVFNLTSQENSAGVRGELSMYSSRGKEVLSREFTDVDSSTPVKLDVSTLNSGLYFLKWHDEEGNIESLKLVVQ
ncbi:T9SS type A sorting domain-containing protein [Halocola ammonii]